MTDRSVVARLRAEAAQFMATMGKAAKATEQVGDSAEKATRKADGAFQRMSKSVQTNAQDIDRLGNASLVAGGLITAGLGYGVKAFADFDQAMSSVNAALPEAGAKMNSLRAIAISMGKDTQFSATEAAQGITELGKAGVSAEAILGGGLKGALDLAASGQLEVAEASEIAASAMTQFGLSGDKVPHIADLLAAGAGKAQGSVRDLGMALNQTGLVADATGLTIEETTAGLAALASAGLTGSDAGTSFKTMLQRLTPQSAEAAAKFDELGISAYDAEGNFVGLANFAGQLQTKMADLTPEARNAAMAVMFGSDAVRASNVLYEQGAAGIAKWTEEVNVAGYAAQQAATLTDNLKGDLERLGGALDTVLIQNGEGANGALRSLVQNIEGAVEAFGSLPGPVQQGALGLVGIAGAGLLAVGAFAKVATTGADLVESMSALRTSAPRVAKGLDMTAAAGKKAALAMVALAAAGAAASFLTDDAGSLGVERLTRDLLTSANAVDAFSASIRANAADMGYIQDDLGSFGDVLKTTFDPGFWDSFDRKGDAFLSTISLGLFDVTTKTDEAEGRLSELDATLAGLAGSGNADKAATLFDQFAAAAEAQGVSVDDLKAKLPGYSEALAAAENEQAAAADSAEGMAGGLSGVEAAAEQAQGAVEDLAGEIRGFGDLALSADEAQAQLADTVDAFSETVTANAAAVKAGEKTKEQATRDNEGALRDIAKASKEAVAANFELTGSQEQATSEMTSARAEFIKNAAQLGITGKAAERLADRYGLLPDYVGTTVEARGAEVARAKVQNLIDTVARLNSKTVTVGVRYVVSGRLPSGGRNLRGGSDAGTGGVDFNADGGMHVQSPVGLVRAYADGGVRTIGAAQPQIARAGGAGILWAEEGAGPWEAFISGHPAKRARSRTIATDTVERLGGRVEWRRFADGGFATGAPRTVTAPTIVTPVGPQRIEGTLDLGNGLTGIVRGVLHQEAAAARGGSSMAGADL